MRIFTSALVVTTTMLTGCATNPNDTWFEGAHMTFKVSSYGNNRYEVTAEGAGAHKPEQVERGFLQRASQLCDGKGFDHQFTTTACTYSAPGGVYGISTMHRAFKTTGTVTCR